MTFLDDLFGMIPKEDPELDGFDFEESEQEDVDLLGDLGDFEI